MFRMKFFNKKVEEKKLFPYSEHPPHQESLRLAHQIAEIYAGFASSRDIEHKVGDGLSKLFDNNLFFLDFFVKCKEKEVIFLWFEFVCGLV